MISSRLPVNGWRNFTGPRWKWRSVLREWPLPIIGFTGLSGTGHGVSRYLDAFMDNKGLITAKEWKESCDDVVLLALLPKFCYSGNEALKGSIKVANYTPTTLKGKHLTWT